jgi:sugar/nucleoside kinase (ribokinase family)
MKQYDAVIAGYLCVDMAPEFQRNESITSIPNLFKPGKLIEIDGLSFTLGGVVANTGMAMKKFNKRVFLNGLIGNDFIGIIAKDWLEKYNLSEGIKTTDRAGTAFGIVLAPPGVDRIFLESPGCSKIFDLDFIDFGKISQSHLFHFGYPPLLRQFYLDNGEQLVKMFSTVKEMGVITSLDFSLPDSQSESGKLDWQQIMRRILPFTDIFVPSLEEVFCIMMPDVYTTLLSAKPDTDIIDLIPVNAIRKIGKKIIDLGVKILLIKAGHRGIYLLTGDISSINNKAEVNLSKEVWNYHEFWCNAYPTDPEKIKNATGAGDTAVAAFLSAILNGKSAEQALQLAAIAGRNNLYCKDIYEDINDWEDMEEEIELGYNEIVRF